MTSDARESDFMDLTPQRQVLGILEDMTWEQRTVQLVPGDMLVLYTDGVTDAEDRKGTFFGPERLLEVVRAKKRLRSLESTPLPTPFATFARMVVHLPE